MPFWNNLGEFEVSELSLVSQERQIKVNGWLTDLELEEPRPGCGYEIAQEVRLDENGSGDYIPTVNNQQWNQVEKIG